MHSRNMWSASLVPICVTQAAASDRPIVYTTTWCGYCYRLKRQLDRAGIGVTEVDIERNPAAAVVVEGLNDGDQTVPTVVFPDGSALTNPSMREVTAKLG
jgi:mycoredoxin